MRCVRSCAAATIDSGRPLCNQLVRVILAHQPAEGARDFRIGRCRGHAEDLVGIGQPRLRPGAGRAPATAGRSPRCARAAAASLRARRTRAANAQHAAHALQHARAAGRPGHCPAARSAAGSARTCGAGRPAPPPSGAGVERAISSGNPAALPCVNSSMARRRSASPSENRCIAARAASISCSVTRPSLLATCPMTRNVVSKKARLSVAGSAVAPPGAP